MTEPRDDFHRFLSDLLREIPMGDVKRAQFQKRLDRAFKEEYEPVAPEPDEPEPEVAYWNDVDWQTIREAFLETLREDHAGWLEGGQDAPESERPGGGNPGTDPDLD